MVSEDKVRSLLGWACLTNPQQDVPWAKMLRGEAIELRCLECATLVALSYAHRSWDSVKLQYETDALFQREFQQACRIMAGERKQDFTPQTFTQTQKLELVLERPYLVYSEDQFAEKFAMAAKDVPGVSVDCLRNERGESMKCVILQEPGPYKLYARSVMATDLGTLLQGKEQCYRPKQGAELAAWYEADGVKQRPPGLKTGMLVSTVEELVAKTKREREERAKAAAEGGGPVAEATAAPEEPEAGVEEAEEDCLEDSVAQLAQVVLPSAAAAAEKSKRKKTKDQNSGSSAKRLRTKQSVNEDKSKKKDGGAASLVGMAAAFSCVSQASSPPRSSKTEGVGPVGLDNRSSASSSGTAKPSASPWQRLVGNAVKYIDVLSDLGQALSGKSVLGVLNQSLRVLEAIERTHPGNPEGITLRAKRELMEVASNVAAPNLATLERERRHGLLEKVMPHVLASDIPLQFQLSLLTKVVSEMRLDTPSTVCDWCNAVVPFGAPSLACVT